MKLAAGQFLSLSHPDETETPTISAVRLNATTVV
jgi:hypothetical protein